MRKLHDQGARKKGAKMTDVAHYCIRHAPRQKERGRPRRSALSRKAGEPEGEAMASFEVLAEDLGFTEGPTCLADGRLLVTSITHGKVYTLRGGRVEAAVETGGGPNGLAAGGD